jgi:predicted DNA-binding protein with PD1-like motif
MPVGALGRIVVVGLKPNEDLVSRILSVARERDVEYAIVQAMGTLSRVVLGFYDGATKTYLKKEINRHLELVSCLGSLAKDSDGKSVLHLHVAVADQDMHVFGGHLIEANVGYLVEAYLNEVAGTELIKISDDTLGLMVFKEATTLEEIQTNPP